MGVVAGKLESLEPPHPDSTAINTDESAKFLTIILLTIILLQIVDLL